MKNILSPTEIDNINVLCKKYKIFDYNINQDGSIDVNGDVELGGKKLTTLPLNFNQVNGNFSCNYNSLSSLKGAPKYVSSEFHCTRNLLTSLEYFPIEVGGYVNCSDNKLSSFKGLPNTLLGLEISNNLITNFEYVPDILADSFCCTSNPLTTLKGFPKLNSSIYFHFNYRHLPTIIYKKLNKFNKEQQILFFKYQDYYEVWTPEFNEDSFLILIEDILDGLA